MGIGGIGGSVSGGRCKLNDKSGGVNVGKGRGGSGGRLIGIGGIGGRASGGRFKLNDKSGSVNVGSGSGGSGGRLIGIGGIGGNGIVMLHALMRSRT